MDPELSLEEYFGGQVYALVVGISEYRNVYDSNEPPAENGFRRLKYAKNDAEDFKRYLSERGVFDSCIFELTDEKATLTDIKIAFEELIKCRNKSDTENPLIIIFFSGHGEADEVYHYLIPFDAQKKYLSATAFKNIDFDEYLKRLKTNKLVVFLDACYSGGAAGNDAKGSENRFDPKEVLGTGTGKYIIASCDKGELSYEGDRGHGIFTQHLLELLKCEGNDTIEEEEINTHNLFSKLYKKVTDTARNKGRAQTPTWNVSGGQEPIKLGVNLRKKKARLSEETTDTNNRVEFQQKLCGMARARNFKYKIVFEAALKKYNSKVKEKVYDKFYEMFAEVYEISLNNSSEDWVNESYELLSACFTDIFLSKKDTTDTVVKPAVSAALLQTPAQAAGNPIESVGRVEKESVDKFVQTGIKGSPSESLNQRPGSSQGNAEPMRKMTDYADYILEPIYHARFFNEYGKLDNCLRQQSVSEKQFMDVLIGIQKQKKDEAELTEKLQTIAARFNERWGAAEEVETQSAANPLFRLKHDK